MDSRVMEGGRREAQIVTARLELSEVEVNRGYSMMHGRAAPYGEVGLRQFYKETWADKLFDKSIRQAAKSLPLLMFHDDMTWPIGSATDWDSVPGDGLYGTWSLDDSADAQRAAKMYAAGHLKYLSVGYQPILSRLELPDAGRLDLEDSSTWGTVTRLEARLLETSIVPVPLYPSAQIMLVAGAGATLATTRRHTATTPELDRWKRWRSSI